MPRRPRLYWIILLIILLSIVPATHGKVSAQPPAPLTPDLPPLPVQTISPPADPDLVGQSSLTTSLSLPPLKAVLIVGPIDGNTGDWTLDEIDHMELAAAELEANGVTVHRFYTPNTDWNTIRAAAEGAHFLFYRGHGVEWSYLNPSQVGGFALANNQFVSNDDIRTQLHLHPGAIVMLYGCYTAGSGTEKGTSSTTARNRVVQYSNPFFDAGAGGYFANWFGDAFQMFVRNLFAGYTLGQSYERYADFNSNTVERYSYPNRAGNVLWLDKDNWGGIVYNNAFAGQSGKTLEDLFGAQLDLSSDRVVMLAEPAYAPRETSVQITAGTLSNFTWNAQVIGGSSEWIQISPASGSSSQPLTVRLDPSVPVGTYQAQIRVWTTAPNVLISEQVMPVEMQVLDTVFNTYLPVSRR